MINTRKTALNALIEYERAGTYTNLALKKHLRDIESERDRKFITVLVYGVIEKKLILDYYISKVSSVKLKKINSVVLNILRLGLYQIMFLSTPESAACNTSVELAKTNGQYKSAGFVNAILRKLAGTHKTIELPPETDDIHLCLKYSVSQSNLKVLIDTLGVEKIGEFFENGYKSCDCLYAAVNTKKVKTDELISMLKSEHIVAETTEFDGLIKITDTVNIEKTPSFLKGFYHIIGLPSYITALAVCSQKGKTVFDMCAAPGGKTFVISYNSDDNDSIYAFDVHEHKIKNIHDSCQRLGIDNVYPKVADGAVYNEEYKNSADTVLCDVPCSGLGMIFKKPDIKYKDIDFESIIDTQFKIISNAAKYLKNGGRLIYSTCTVNYNENKGVVDKFLSLNPDFSLDTSTEIYGGRCGELQFLPNDKFSDGFYVAVLCKK